MALRPLSAAAFVILSLGPLRAWSFDLLPISREFSPSGSGAVQSYEVVNPGPDPIAISIGVLSRELDAAGVETNHSAEDDFLVYPPQFIVGPGMRQTVRVSYLGSPLPPEELAYRLLVEQLPIERFLPRPPEGARVSARVTVLTRYKGSMYVKPAHARPELVVESAQQQMDLAGHPQLVVTVRNHGTARAVLKESAFEVQSGNSRATISAADLSLPSSVVLPGGRRRLSFPWPEGLLRGGLVASLLP